jgi:hypothetical protein
MGKLIKIVHTKGKDCVKGGAGYVCDETKWLD